jgi:hypothetical protein
MHMRCNGRKYFLCALLSPLYALAVPSPHYTPASIPRRHPRRTHDIPTSPVGLYASRTLLSFVWLHLLLPCRHSHRAHVTPTSPVVIRTFPISLSPFPPNAIILVFPAWPSRSCHLILACIVYPNCAATSTALTPHQPHHRLRRACTTLTSPVVTLFQRYILVDLVTIDASSFSILIETSMLFYFLLFSFWF